jgi:hypothetical protein
VGFFGDLRARSVDFSLIAEAARLRPDISFVLGGTQLDDLSTLRASPNVHLLPPCDHAAMAPRWRALDLAMLPYRQRPWLVAAEPVKLGEILATGLLAVATPLPCYSPWLDRVALARDAAAFVVEIDAQLARRQASEGPLAPPPGLRTWDDIAEEALAVDLDPPPVLAVSA